MTSKTLSMVEVCSNQQQLHFIQIAINRADVVLKQLTDDQLSMKWNLSSAITYLKMAEADLSEQMGFDWHAKDCRAEAIKSAEGPEVDWHSLDWQQKALMHVKRELNNYLTIGKK